MSSKNIIVNISYSPFHLPSWEAWDDCYIMKIIAREETTNRANIKYQRENYLMEEFHRTVFPITDQTNCEQKEECSEERFCHCRFGPFYIEQMEWNARLNWKQLQRKSWQKQENSNKITFKQDIRTVSANNSFDNNSIKINSQLESWTCFCNVNRIPFEAYWIFNVCKNHQPKSNRCVFFLLPRLHSFPFVLSQHGVIDTNGLFIENQDLSDNIVNFNLTFSI